MRTPAMFVDEFDPTLLRHCVHATCYAGVVLTDASDLVLHGHIDYSGDANLCVCWVCPACGSHNDLLRIGDPAPRSANEFIELVKDAYHNQTITLPEAALRDAFAHAMR